MAGTFSQEILWNLSMFFLLCLTVVPHTTAIQCYKCTITPPGQLSNETKRLCVDFDYSAKYVVDCPYSTMCMKKAFQSILGSNEKVYAERDCAAQKDNYQVLKNNSWHEATSIREVYSEGCHIQDDKGARTLPTEYCFCSSHLCNSATSRHKGGELSYHTDAMAVIMVVNAMKYFQSTR